MYSQINIKLNKLHIHMINGKYRNIYIPQITHRHFLLYHQSTEHQFLKFWDSLPQFFRNKIFIYYKNSKKSLGYTNSQHCSYFWNTSRKKLIEHNFEQCPRKWLHPDTRYSYQVRHLALSKKSSKLKCISLLI